MGRYNRPPRSPPPTDLSLFLGIFELIASIIIFIMGITMLKMDRAKAKWRVKLERAFEGQRQSLGDFRYFYSCLYLGTNSLSVQMPTEVPSLENGSSSSCPLLLSFVRVWKLSFSSAVSPSDSLQPPSRLLPLLESFVVSSVVTSSTLSPVVLVCIHFNWFRVLSH